MNPSEEQPNPKEMRDAMRYLQIQIRNTAFAHFDRIGLRSLRSLQNLNLIDEKTPKIGQNVDLEVLRDLEHERRQGYSIGPLLLYETDESQKKRMLVELPMLIFSDEEKIRSEALLSLMKMGAKDSFAYTPRTANILENSRNSLSAQDSEDWIPAAIAIYDAVDNDVLIAFNGVHQCLESDPVLEDSLNSYTPKILYPSVDSLDSISLAIGQPERDHKTLKALLATAVADAKSLVELCRLYYTNFGFLPLAPSFSLASAVKEWVSLRDAIDVWKEVWDWAENETTPTALYHACGVFILHPDFIPEDKLPEFWNKLLRVISRSKTKDENLSCRERWLLRRDLARHYTFHLEARLPDNDGASIACFAWWFSEKVAALFPDDDGSAQFYRENWVKPASELSSHTWLVANSHVGTSFLRQTTFTVQSPWVLSLLALLGDNILKLAPLEQSEDVISDFQDALVSNALSSMPYTVNSKNNATFALECSLEKTLKEWKGLCSGENREVSELVISMNRSFGSNQELCDALQNINSSKLPDQVAILSALRRKAYLDTVIAEDLWDLVSCPKWRNKTFSSLKHELQDILIDALSQVMIATRDKWSHYLPHYMAEICEHESDQKRRREFFLYVLHLCLASGTVSAAKRLLQSEHKSEYLDEVEKYRSQVEAMRSNYPPWVAGKLRGILASLYVH